VSTATDTAIDPAIDSVTFEALGTTVRIEACADIAGAEREVRAVLVAIDAACSRFRDDSELMAVNRAGGRPVALSPLAARAVRVALDAAARTNGAVDLTVGATVRSLGYDVSFEQLPSARPPIVHVVDTPGWRAVRLDDDGTVHVPNGVLLDLGATAKALAADLAAERAAARTGGGVLVSIGGDIALAAEPPANGWTVGIADSHRTNFADVDEIVTLWRGGLATSSTTVRRWCVGDSIHHHIVDPATGRSASSGWRTVTVAAGGCVDANVLATWGVIHGPGGAERAGCPYRAVTDAGAVRRGNGWQEPS
jgi:FAD:protein FMN transferase